MNFITVYFVRHSVRDASIHDSINAPLTSEGKYLASQLPSFFANKTITAIHSSPYQRVVETLLPIAQSLQLDIQLHHDLRERYIGQWVDDFTAFADKQWQHTDYSLHGGESLREVSVRITEIVYKIVRESYGDIIIGGHGTAFSVLFQNLFEIDGYSLFQTMKMPDIFYAQWDGNKFSSLTRLPLDSQ